MNKIHNALNKIHAEEALKTKTKNAVYEKIIQSGTKRRFSLRALSSIAAICLTLIIAGAAGYYSYYTPVYAISIDINPSLEFGINRFDRVISVDGYNSDGSELASVLDLKNMSYTDALNALLASVETQKYTGNGAEVTVTVSGGNDEKTSEILSAVESCHSGSNAMYCYESNDSAVEEAHKNGVSFGKYSAYLELKKYNSSVTIDDIKDMTMHDIHRMLDEYTGTESHSSDSHHTADEDQYKNQHHSH